MLRTSFGCRLFITLGVNLNSINIKAKTSRDILLLKYFYIFLAVGMFWLAYEYSLLSQREATKHLFLGMLSKLCEITNTTTITIFLFLMGLWFTYNAYSAFIKKLLAKNT